MKNLVLIGGDHPHAVTLRMFGMKPLPGVRLSLISEASDESAYAGTIPGHVAGFDSREACHINLWSLTDSERQKAEGKGILFHDVSWSAAGRNTVMKTFRQCDRNFRLHQLWALSDCPAHFAKGHLIDLSVFP